MAKDFVNAFMEELFSGVNVEELFGGAANHLAQKKESSKEAKNFIKLFEVVQNVQSLGNADLIQVAHKELHKQVELLQSRFDKNTREFLILKEMLETSKFVKSEILAICEIAGKQVSYQETIKKIEVLAKKKENLSKELLKIDNEIKKLNEELIQEQVSQFHLNSDF